MRLVEVTPVATVADRLGGFRAQQHKPKPAWINPLSIIGVSDAAEQDAPARSVVTLSGHPYAAAIHVTEDTELVLVRWKRAMRRR